MTESGVTMERLHSMVLRELDSDTVLEIDADTYQNIAVYAGSLRRQEFDGIDNKVRDTADQMVSTLTRILLRLRLQKALETRTPDNLLDEEKYILDAEDEKNTRMNMVVSAATRGKVRQLQYVSGKHRTRMLTVRMLEDTEALVGADYDQYGPFLGEDIATLPYDNAKALIANGSAAPVTWIN